MKGCRPRGRAETKSFRYAALCLLCMIVEFWLLRLMK